MTAHLNQPVTDGIRMQTAHIGHPAQILMHADDIDGQIEIAARALSARMDVFTDVEGSSWVTQEILSVELNIAAYDAILGSNFIPTPYSIKNKQAIINV